MLRCPRVPHDAIANRTLPVWSAATLDDHMALLTKMAAIQLSSDSTSSVRVNDHCSRGFLKNTRLSPAMIAGKVLAQMAETMSGSETLHPEIESWIKLPKETRALTI